MKNIAVIGAGAIGICCALELRKKGFTVTLIDSEKPASQASYGNAGVICTNGITPYASPQILPQLPFYGLNRDPRFLFHWPHFFSLLPWISRFIRNCNWQSYHHSLRSLSYISRDAVQLHKERLHQSKATDLLRDQGWLRLYRTKQSFDSTKQEQENFKNHDVPYEILNSKQISDLEPDIYKKYERGILLNGSPSVTNPQRVCHLYFEQYLSMGGQFFSGRITSIMPKNNTWKIIPDSGADTSLPTQFDHVVVAMGAHTPEILKPLGIKIPMAIERGYHLAYKPQAERSLSRSILDTERGLVLTPMEMDDGNIIRVTSAVNLIARPTQPTFKQILDQRAEIDSIFPMQSQQIDTPWIGHRPSMPDSIPVIGPAPRNPGLWLAFGHGHLGFTLGPKTGQLIARSIAGEINDPESNAFLPGRFQQ